MVNFLSEREFAGRKKGGQKTLLLNSINGVTVAFISTLLWQGLKAWETGRLVKGINTICEGGPVDSEYSVV
jgi:hypothetical protein